MSEKEQQQAETTPMPRSVRRLVRKAMRSSKGHAWKNGTHCQVDGEWVEIRFHDGGVFRCNMATVLPQTLGKGRVET